MRPSQGCLAAACPNVPGRASIALCLALVPLRHLTYTTRGLPDARKGVLMAVAEHDQATESSEGGARNTALKAAAAAAATGAATFAVRRMLSQDPHGSD